MLLMTCLLDNRDRHCDARPASWRGVEFDRAAEQFDPLAHPEETQAAFARGRRREALRREPLPIVFDLDGNPIIAFQVLDEDGLRLRVLGDVGNRLLDDAEQRRFQFWHEPTSGAAELAAHGDAAPLEVALGVPADRGEQAKVCLLY